MRVKKFHIDFQFTLMRNMLAHAGPEQKISWKLGRPPNVESHIARLKVCSSNQLAYPIWDAAKVLHV
jgi:hypothetical protein